MCFIKLTRGSQWHLCYRSVYQDRLMEKGGGVKREVGPQKKAEKLKC
jgi:hypothetical protein